MLHPIVVTTDLRLVAGHHRLEACKRLGQATIEATVISLDDLDAQLVEIDENLARNELTVLERGEMLAARKALYEAKHPETKHGGSRRNQPSKLQKMELGQAVPSFVEATAAIVRQSPATIYDHIRIADGLADDVKDAIRSKPLAGQKTALLDLARRPHEEQRKAIQKTGDGAEPPTALFARPRTSRSARTKAPLVKPVRGRRSPKRELPRVQELRAFVVRARSGWRALVREWDERHREDMQWALDASQEVIAALDGAMAKLTTIARGCGEEVAA